MTDNELWDRIYRGVSDALSAHPSKARNPASIAYARSVADDFAALDQALEPLRNILHGISRDWSYRRDLAHKQMAKLARTISAMSDLELRDFAPTSGATVVAAGLSVDCEVSDFHKALRRWAQLTVAMSAEQKERSAVRRKKQSRADEVSGMVSILAREWRDKFSEEPGAGEESAFTDAVCVVYEALGYEGKAPSHPTIRAALDLSP